jgi:hypothetical protein
MIAVEQGGNRVLISGTCIGDQAIEQQKASMATFLTP